MSCVLAMNKCNAVKSILIKFLALLLLCGTFKTYLISVWLVAYLCLQDSDPNPFNVNGSCFFPHWGELKKFAVSFFPQNIAGMSDTPALLKHSQVSVSFCL